MSPTRMTDQGPPEPSMRSRRSIVGATPLAAALSRIASAAKRSISAAAAAAPARAAAMAIRPDPAPKSRTRWPAMSAGRGKGPIGGWDLALSQHLLGRLPQRRHLGRKMEAQLRHQLRAGEYRIGA